MKKERAVAVNVRGYAKYFGLSAASLGNETDFEVDEGATKAKIKSAFMKSLKTKKLNKKVLGEFVELIACMSKRMKKYPLDPHFIDEETKTVYTYVASGWIYSDGSSHKSRGAFSWI